MTRAEGRIDQVADWQPHGIRDELLIPGQNPASAAKLLLEALTART